jgi:hypothetical protein
MLHAVVVTHAMELAIARVHEAMDRVLAAWEAEGPDLPLPAVPPRPAWHPDPSEAPAITRQRAEVACLRADCLHQQALQACARAKQVHQMTRELHALLQRARKGHEPESFTRVSVGILLPPTTRRRH